MERTRGEIVSLYIPLSYFVSSEIERKTQLINCSEYFKINVVSFGAYYV